MDYDYLDVLGLKIAEGRNLSREIASDATGNYLINEAAARELGMVNPVGMDLQVINRQRQKGKIVGVVKDFHYASLHRRIEPLAMWIGSGEYWLVALRISSGHISQTLKVIEQEWSRLAPAFPFAYKFLDEDFDRLYKSEQKLSAVLVAFSSLAVFIACLGLLGLSAFIAEQRTKEVGPAFPFIILRKGGAKSSALRLATSSSCFRKIFSSSLPSPSSSPVRLPIGR